MFKNKDSHKLEKFNKNFAVSYSSISSEKSGSDSEEKEEVDSILNSKSVGSKF